MFLSHLHNLTSSTDLYKSQVHIMILPHLTSNVLINMKSFIAFMAFLALANGQFTCDECKQGVTQLGQYLLTDAELAAVEEALSDLVCPTLPEENIEGCIAGVYAWWPQVAQALFAYPDTVTNLCAGIGYCKKMQPRVSPFIFHNPLPNVRYHIYI